MSTFRTQAVQYRHCSCLNCAFGVPGQCTGAAAKANHVAWRAHYTASLVDLTRLLCAGDAASFDRAMARLGSQRCDLCGTPSAELVRDDDGQTACQACRGAR